MNVQGMLPFENEVARYVESTDNHVMYRVTPIFEGDNLVASGVLMEAKSVEDNGEGVEFNVYCYNAQPGIEINYATGENYKVDVPQENTTNETGEKTEYILNTGSKKFHLPSCEGVDKMSEKNKQSFFGYKNDLISKGYEACKTCNP
jgi:DNA-entry nuclease